jgi:hypothetical protein
VATLFFSYSHADEALRDRLEKHLAALQRQGLIDTWHDRRIQAGQDFGNEIDDHLNAADVVLLLVSADFLASDYCYDREMLRAMERHTSGDAVVIPVILRPCDWHDTPAVNSEAPALNGGRRGSLFETVQSILLLSAVALRQTSPLPLR